MKIGENTICKIQYLPRYETNPSRGSMDTLLDFQTVAIPWLWKSGRLSKIEFSTEDYCIKKAQLLHSIAFPEPQDNTMFMEIWKDIPNFQNSIPYVSNLALKCWSYPYLSFVKTSKNQRVIYSSTQELTSRISWLNYQVLS